jgi:hypothetical protein
MPTARDRAAGAVFKITPGVRYWRDWPNSVDTGSWYRHEADRPLTKDVADAFDMNDRATVGCLVDQVRVALRNPTWHPVTLHPVTLHPVTLYNDSVGFASTSEADVILAAMSISGFDA